MVYHPHLYRRRCWSHVSHPCAPHGAAAYLPRYGQGTWQTPRACGPVPYLFPQDGLLPATFNKIHPKFGTPYITTLTSGVICALFAGLLPVDILGNLTSVGTLCAYPYDITPCLSKLTHIPPKSGVLLCVPLRHRVETH